MAWICSDCGASFTSPGIDKHLVEFRHSLKCPCGHTYSSRRGFQMHMNRRCPARENPFYSSSNAPQRKSKSGIETVGPSPGSVPLVDNGSEIILDKTTPDPVIKSSESPQKFNKNGNNNGISKSFASNVAASQVRKTPPEKPLVVLLYPNQFGYATQTPETKALRDTATMAFCTPEELNSQILEKAEVIVTGNDSAVSFDAPTLRTFVSLKKIVSLSPNHHIDLACAANLGIEVNAVINNPLITDDQADLGMTMILALYRDLPHQIIEPSAITEQAIAATNGVMQRKRIGLRGQVLGLVGLDYIAKSLAQRAQAFGMKVIFFDPEVDDVESSLFNVTRAASLFELLSQSNVVSLHHPSFEILPGSLQAQNRPVINEISLKKLKHGAFLINVCDSSLLDLGAISNALALCQLAGIACAAGSKSDLTILAQYNTYVASKRLLIFENFPTITDQLKADALKIVLEYFTNPVASGQAQHCLNREILAQIRVVKSRIAAKPSKKRATPAPSNILTPTPPINKNIASPSLTNPLSVEEESTTGVIDLSSGTQNGTKKRKMEPHNVSDTENLNESNVAIRDDNESPDDSEDSSLEIPTIETLPTMEPGNCDPEFLF